MDTHALHTSGLGTVSDSGQFHCLLLRHLMKVKGPLCSVNFHKPLGHIGQTCIFFKDTFRTTHDYQLKCVEDVIED